MNDNEPKEAIGTRRSRCANGIDNHHEFIVLADDSRVLEADAIALLDAGCILYMKNPGSTARLLLQHRRCEPCQREVLFA
jgi:hypothetical protein